VDEDEMQELPLGIRPMPFVHTEFLRVLSEEQRKILTNIQCLIWVQMQKVTMSIFAKGATINFEKMKVIVDYTKLAYSRVYHNDTHIREEECKGFAINLLETLRPYWDSMLYKKYIIEFPKDPLTLISFLCIRLTLQLIADGVPLSSFKVKLPTMQDMKDMIRIGEDAGDFNKSVKTAKLPQGYVEYINPQTSGKTYFLNKLLLPDYLTSEGKFKQKLGIFTIFPYVSDYDLKLCPYTPSEPKPRKKTAAKSSEHGMEVEDVADPLHGRPKFDKDHAEADEMGREHEAGMTLEGPAYPLHSRPKFDKDHAKADEMGREHEAGMTLEGPAYPLDSRPKIDRGQANANDTESEDEDGMQIVKDKDQAAQGGGLRDGGNTSKKRYAGAPASQQSSKLAKIEEGRSWDGVNLKDSTEVLEHLEKTLTHEEKACLITMQNELIMVIKHCEDDRKGVLEMIKGVSRRVKVAYPSWTLKRLYEFMSPAWSIIVSEENGIFDEDPNEQVIAIGVQSILDCTQDHEFKVGAVRLNQIMTLYEKGMGFGNEWAIYETDDCTIVGFPRFLSDDDDRDTFPKYVIGEYWGAPNDNEALRNIDYSPKTRKELIEYLKFQMTPRIQSVCREIQDLFVRQVSKSTVRRLSRQWCDEFTDSLETDKLKLYTTIRLFLVIMVGWKLLTKNKEDEKNMAILHALKWVGCMAKYRTNPTMMKVDMEEHVKYVTGLDVKKPWTQGLESYQTLLLTFDAVGEGQSSSESEEEEEEEGSDASGSDEDEEEDDSSRSWEEVNMENAEQVSDHLRLFLTLEEKTCLITIQNELVKRINNCEEDNQVVVKMIKDIVDVVTPKYPKTLFKNLYKFMKPTWDTMFKEDEDGDTPSLITENSYDRVVFKGVQIVLVCLSHSDYNFTTFSPFLLQLVTLYEKAREDTNSWLDYADQEEDDENSISGFLLFTTEEEREKLPKRIAGEFWGYPNDTEAAELNDYSPEKQSDLVTFLNIHMTPRLKAMCREVKDLLVKQLRKGLPLSPTWSADFVKSIDNDRLKLCTAKRFYFVVAYSRDVLVKNMELPNLVFLHALRWVLCYVSDLDNTAHPEAYKENIEFLNSIKWDADLADQVDRFEPPFLNPAAALFLKPDSKQHGRKSGSNGRMADAASAPSKDRMGDAPLARKSGSNGGMASSARKSDSMPDRSSDSVEEEEPTFQRRPRKVQPIVPKSKKRGKRANLDSSDEEEQEAAGAAQGDVKSGGERRRTRVYPTDKYKKPIQHSSKMDSINLSGIRERLGIIITYFHEHLSTDEIEALLIMQDNFIQNMKACDGDDEAIREMFFDLAKEMKESSKYNTASFARLKRALKYNWEELITYDVFSVYDKVVFKAVKILLRLIVTGENAGPKRLSNFIYTFEQSMQKTNPWVDYPHSLKANIGFYKIEASKRTGGPADWGQGYVPYPEQGFAPRSPEILKNFLNMHLTYRMKTLALRLQHYFAHVVRKAVKDKKTQLTDDWCQPLTNKLSEDACNVVVANRLLLLLRSSWDLLFEYKGTFAEENQAIFRAVLWGLLHITDTPLVYGEMLSNTYFYFEELDLETIAPFFKKYKRQDHRYSEGFHLFAPRVLIFSQHE